MSARLPENEVARLAALHSYGVLDEACDTSFDHIATVASLALQCPIALVSLVDSERQCFKGRVGIEASETSRDVSFCAYAILQPDELMVVPDALQDHRFSNNPVVDELGIRFYAGAPLVDAGGAALGTLCVIDRVPRELRDDQKRILRYLAETVVTTLELRRAMNKVRTAALTDPLTRLANRPALIEGLDRVIGDQKREGPSFSLLCLDLDGFKQINDQHGHATGDRVLRQVAKTLSGNVRSTDIAARFGGDEFAVLICGNNLNAAASAERICRRLQIAMNCKGWAVTASIGAVTFESPPDDVEQALAAADRLMYRAKASGKNCIEHQTFGRRQTALGTGCQS